jgi:hypothetical protein
MKKAVYVLSISVAAFSCKAPSYSYLPAGRNVTAYSRAGEGMVGVGWGTEGFSARGGVALTQNININGWIGGMPEVKDGYTSRESELSIGFQTNPNSNNRVTSFYLGLGNGSNEKDKVGLSGHYNRGFLQIQRAGFDRSLGGSIKFDGCFGLRINYLSYDGTRQGANFNDDLFFYEPYFGAAIGGKNVRLQIIQGWAIKNTGEMGHGVQVFPFFAHIGLLVKIRKN